MAGGFTLQKWTTNDPSVLKEVDGHRQMKSNERNIAEDSHARALGLSWKPSADTFSMRPRPAAATNIVTKRVVLSRIAQIFDPLGWITPVTIALKVFLQDLWKIGMGWDDAVPPDFERRWREYDSDLDNLHIEIPRWLGFTSATTQLELHGFSDASQNALGAAVYAKVYEGPEVRVRLIAAKSKVAPIKKLTIPRLELSAAVLLARLVNRVTSTLNLHAVPIYLWVDSSVTLAWIRGHPSRWKEFVANRVTLISDLVPAATWRHIPGIDNPADCASRGISPTLLKEGKLWWFGPPWLTQPCLSWPSDKSTIDDSIDLEERHPQSSVVTSHLPASWDLIIRYSNFSRLIRITAWLTRAVSRFRKSSNMIHSLILSPTEIRNAEIFWLKHTQAIYFTEELSLLSRGKVITKQHALIRLIPLIDGDGLLRVGGRLRHALLEPDAKHPILFPRDSTITSLILHDTHRRTLHGSVQLMLSVIRQRFWILGGRASVASFVRRCVRCARYRAAAAKELMGQLPSTRVTPSRPFLHTGVDYAGPFALKTLRGRSGRTYKSFLVVFVCFATSAVHLEVATDYSAQGFIAAYRRFTGRRGVCSTLTSDCGTNFIGVEKELRRLFDAASKDVREIANEIALLGTEWKFHPPAAPHFGGKWEAAVKSVKYHLRRLIGDSILTYEEFSTLLIQIEAILNSRPLCPLSNDPSDLEALTTSHFLIGSSIMTIPEPSLEDVAMSRLSQWQMLQQLLQRFWRRWTSEYLQRLQGISKWQHPMNQIKKGDLVLLMDERFPPSKWPLGRIVQTHPEQDGLIRVVTVRTATSEFKRPIVKLCPLPVAT